MISRWITTAVAVLLLNSPALAGRTYYVRSVGNDANNGLTWATAWRTNAKVQSTIVAGDTVLYGAGIYWGTMLNPPAGGNNNTWTVYADSTFKTDPMASKGLATLSGGYPVTGWVDTTIGGVAADKSSGFNPPSCVGAVPYCAVQPFSGTDSQLVYQPGLASVSRNGEYYYSNGTVYVNAYNNVNLGTNDTIIVSCSPPVRITNTNVSCVRFWGLQLLHAHRAPVTLAGTDVDSVIIEHCHIAYGGIESLENPSAFYSTDIGVSSSRYGNTLRADSIGWFLTPSSSSDGTTPPFSGCTFGGAVDIYSQDHVLIESCYVYNVVYDGIFFKYAILNSTVRYNTVANAIGTGALCTYNYAVRDSFYGNIVIKSARGIRADNTGTGSADSNFFFNNSIYNVSDAFMTEERTSSSGVQVIRYNAFFKDGGSDGRWVKMSNDPDGSHWSIDYNIYYDEPWSSFSASGAGSWGAWQGSGRDQQGDTVNPLFANPAGGDFTRPAATSEMSQSYGGRPWTVFGAIQSSGLQQYNQSATYDSTKITISWWTTDSSTSEVRYSQSPLLLDFTKLTGPTRRTYHEYTISHPANTTYYYMLLNYDTVGGDTVQSLVRSLNVDYLPPDPAIISLQSLATSSNLAQGITPAVCGTYAGYTASVLTDGTVNAGGGTASTWASDDDVAAPHWVVIDFGTPRNLDRVILHWAYNSNTSTWMTSRQYYVQSWTGSQYVTLVTVSDPIPSAATETVLTPPSYTSRLRVYQPAGMGPTGYASILWLTELEAQGQ